MSKDILPDNLLKEAVAKAWAIENAICEGQEAKLPEHTFSDEYRQKMRRLIDGTQIDGVLTEEKPERRRRVIKKKSLRIKILLVAAIVMMLGSMTVLAVEPLREKIYQMVELLFWDHTDIRFEEMAEEMNGQSQEISLKNYKIQKLTKVPSKFKKENARIDYTFFDYTESYCDEKGHAMHYRMGPAEDFTASVTSDGKPAKIISFRGEKAYLLTDNSGWHNIFYVKDGYVYDLGGYEEVEELIKILESAFDTSESPGIVHPEEKGSLPGKEISELYMVRKLENLPKGYKLSWEEENIDGYQFVQGYFGDSKSMDDDCSEILYMQQPEEYFDRSIISDKNKVTEIMIGGEKVYAMPGDELPHKIVMIKDKIAYTLEGDERKEVLIEILKGTLDTGEN